MRRKIETLLQYFTAELLLEDQPEQEEERRRLAIIHETLGWVL